MANTIVTWLQAAHSTYHLLAARHKLHQKAQHFQQKKFQQYSAKTKISRTDHLHTHKNDKIEKAGLGRKTGEEMGNEHQTMTTSFAPTTPIF